MRRSPPAARGSTSSTRSAFRTARLRAAAPWTTDGPGRSRSRSRTRWRVCGRSTSRRPARRRSRRARVVPGRSSASPSRRPAGRSTRRRWETYTKQFSFKNLFGSFTGSATGTSLGSAFARPTATLRSGGDDDAAVPDRRTLGCDEPPRGVGNPVEPNTDLDLFVFDPQGNLVGQSAGSTAHES